MTAQNEKCTNTGTERHGPLHYSLDEAIMSQKQFEVVKCLFLAWNHLWCFRFVVVCFRVLFALKFVVSTIEIDG